MKNVKTAFFSLLLSLLAFSNLKAVDQLPENIIDMGIFRVPGNKLEIRIKPTITLNSVNYQDGWFVVKFPTSYTDNSLAISTTPYNYLLTAPVGGTNESGGFRYFIFHFGWPDSWNPGTWTANTEYVVATLQINGTNIPANGDFRLTEDAFAQTITGGSAFYQQLTANGMTANDNGSQGVFYQESALPIELTNFTARAQPDQTVALDWETAAELNFSHYSVEHSTDGATYVQIGKVDGKGTQNGPETYSFIHNRPVIADNFYRLKNVDNDGAFSYSPVRIVRFGKEKEHFTLSPNPTAGPFTLISTNLDQYDEDLRYQIFDVTGKLIEEGLVKDERLDFDLSNYKSGMYSFAILSNKEFIKQFQLVLTTH